MMTGSWVSDSDVLTVHGVAQGQAARSKRAFPPYGSRHWRGSFPRLVSQRAFNRRGRKLVGALSQDPAWATAYTVLDSVPGPAPSLLG